MNFLENSNGSSDTKDGNDADEENNIKDVIKEAKAAARVSWNRWKSSCLINLWVKDVHWFTSQTIVKRIRIEFQFDDLEHGLHRIHSIKVDTSLLIYFFGQKGDGQLGFDDFRKFMDNLQTEVNWKMIDSSFMLY